jgi:copper chaperone
MTTALESTVAGVTCTGCARGIRMGLLGLPEVTAVDVEVDTGRVRVTGDPLDGSRIERQLTWLGFPPTSEEDDDADR